MWLDDFEIVALIYFMIGLFATGLTMLLGYIGILIEKKKNVVGNSKSNKGNNKGVLCRCDNINNLLDKRIHDDVRNTLSDSRSKEQELGYNPWQE